MNRFDGKQVQDWSEYAGCRCIVIEDRFGANTIEVKVLEVSPKGRVKFKYPSVYESWKDKEEYLLVEVLFTSKEE